MTSHSSILVTVAEGQDSMKAGMSMEEDAYYSTLANRENISVTADISHQLSPLSPCTDAAIDGFSTRTEHIEHRPSDAVAVEQSVVSHAHAPSSDVQVPSSRTLGLTIGMLLPLNSAVALSDHTFFSLESHSQMSAPAASGPCRSRDPSAAVEGEESAKVKLCKERGKEEPHDDYTLSESSDAPMRLLSFQPNVDVAIAGLSRSSLDAEHAGEYSPSLQGQHDIV